MEVKGLMLLGNQDKLWPGGPIHTSTFLTPLTLYLPDQICHSPHCQPYNSYYNVRSENLVLDQLIIPNLIFFFILITYLVDIVLIL